VAVYGAAVLAASARSSPADAGALLLVFATMHLSWGVGFLRGCATLGVPWRALAALIRQR
jgi:hypothetical protein